MKKTLALLIGLHFSHAEALNLPEEARVPGGIAIIPIPEYLSATTPQAYLNGERTPVVKSETGEWLAVAGIPVSASPGEMNLLVKSGTLEESIPFVTMPKQYKEQHIHLTNTRHVNPDPEDLKRIETEQREQTAAYRHFSPMEPVLRFDLLPATGNLVSPFGLKRFFNEEPRAPHAGLDISAAEGQTVVAPADGTVIQTGDYFFNGQTVLLDHGNGVISMMCHLSRILVSPGQNLKKGEPLGNAGHTGRATGPHLHWSVSINNARIDPMLMLSTELRAQLQPEKEKAPE